VCLCVSECAGECDCVCLSLCVSANFFDYNTDFAIFVSTGFRKWFFYLSVFVSAIWLILVFADSTRSRVNFINLLRTHFLYESKLSSFSLITFGFAIFWHQTFGEKVAPKMLMQLTQELLKLVD